MCFFLALPFVLLSFVESRTYVCEENSCARVFMCAVVVHDAMLLLFLCPPLLIIFFFLFLFFLIVDYSTCFISLVPLCSAVYKFYPDDDAHHVLLVGFFICRRLIQTRWQSLQMWKQA